MNDAYLIISFFFALLMYFLGWIAGFADCQSRIWTEVIRQRQELRRLALGDEIDDPIRREL